MRTIKSIADIFKLSVSADKPTINVTGKIDEVVYDDNGKFRPITREASGGVFANGKWNSITAYAGGGSPSGGELFLAREAGPELVGRMGQHTTVMNNDQIVASVSDGVANANEMVVGAVMSAAAQIVNAINNGGSRNGETNFDYLARAVTTWQKRNSFANGV